MKPAAGPAVRALGEAPGVLSSFILRHVLPGALPMYKGDLDEELPPCEHIPVLIDPHDDDMHDCHLLRAFEVLRERVMAQIQGDRRTPLAGKLWGAMSQLPGYLDLATDECGAYEVCYPEAEGGGLVARGESFPSSWRSPKERWLLTEIENQLARNRRVLVYIRHTGNSAFVARLQRLLLEDLGVTSTFLDARRVGARRRKRWLDRTIRAGCRVLFVQPLAVQTGLNNLTAFPTAIWYEGPVFDARAVRQANGRVHRIGQTEPVEILYPAYADTLQEIALGLVAKKVSASEQVDGLSMTAALEAAGAGDDLEHVQAALAFGQALYAASSRRKPAAS